MEKILKLYTYVDGVHDTPFPNEEHQVVTSTFRSDYKRMGGAPTISCTIMHHLCLDKLWTDNVYATFNGEKFFIKQIPSSSFDNTDARYKHELELVSERFVLDNVYFYDVVNSSANYDKPVSNSSKFVFFGDIREFASRLNQSLQYSKVGYSVVVDDGISSESKMVTFQDQFFSNAIQESYNTYNIPYYFVGKVIHFGYTNNAITNTFKYGQDESLLSIQKQNANYKIVNRVTGVGSADNIPYYYPNDYESKAEVEANGGTWINPQTNLMPSIYRETLGSERFYNAINFAYENPISGTLYEFANPYVEGKPKEHIVNFEDIKPTIKGITNANGYRIDMFSAFAYDTNDNDEVDDEGNYVHPYFFAKLRKFDGEHGFNLFDHAIDEQEMTISMTSGSCGACEFVIGVDESTQKNTVQVDDNGYLERDDDGNVKFGTPQDKQNDTINNEVWIALRKDIDTFGVIMPNATNNYKPSVNDTFVILHIDLPKAYILAAEDNLKNQLIEYMALNNSEKFNFSISFSRIFFAEHPEILEQLNENARIQIEYDNTNYELYISSYSYSMSSDKPLPEIRVELSDTLTISQNALQTAINEIKSEIISSGGVGGGYAGDILKLGLKYFLRKDTDDRSKGKISTDKAFEVGKFVQGASGAIIQLDAKNGQTIAELDKLYVRMKAYFETLEIINVNSIGGKMILSPAGSVTCLGVEELDDAYRCYFLGEQDGEIIENRWKVGMQAYSQMFNAKEGVSNKVANTYYWRLVTEVSRNTVEYNNQKCHYIDLSKTDCDSGSDIPKAGDVINHRGCRNDVDYKNFIEFSSVGTNAPYITLFQGVDSYSLVDKEYVSFGYDQSTGRSYMNVYGDMYFGNRDGSSFIKYNPEDGLEVKGKLSVGSTYNGNELGDLFDKQQEDLEKFTEAVTKEFENIRNEMDGAIDTWFGEETPTLENYPAVDWVTDTDKDSHLGDLFYTNDGKAYRFQYDSNLGVYYWAVIEDSEVIKALELAQKALDTADGKRRVFIEQPYPPYDLGDLWAGGESQPLKRCINARESGSYYKSDWALADDSHAYTDAVKKELEDSINATKLELDNAIEDAEAAAKNYTDEGKAVLQQSINQLNEAKANVNDVYTKTQADNKITRAEEDAIAAAKAQADAAIKLSEETTKAYADGEITKEEEARIKQAADNLAAAKKYAEEKANEAFNKAHKEIVGYEYLKQALKEDTTIEGGLIQSSLIKLGYTGDSGYVVMAGSNGTLDTNLGDKSIAFWAGGDMLDRENGSTGTNAADFLVRMDGTGYAAGGNLSWDATGKITANPLSFFVGEKTVGALLTAFKITTNNGGLATLIEPLANFTHLNVNGKLNFGDIPMYKSKSGVVYLEGNLVVKGGITMFGSGTTDVPNIMDSITVDGTTIIIENGVLKINPDIELGGGLDYTALQDYLTQNSYLNVLEADSRYLPLTGGTMSGVLTFDYKNNQYAYITQVNNRATETGGGWAIVAYRFLNAAKEQVGSIGTRGDKNVLSYIYIGHNNYGEDNLRIYSDKVTFGDAALATINDNVASATKLKTPRTIWGQSFDGTADISGNLTMDNFQGLYQKDTSGNSLNSLYTSKNNNLVIGSGHASKGYNTYLYGNSIFFRYGTSSKNGLIFNSNGNLTIGDSDLAGSGYKLYVNGSSRFIEQVILDSQIRSVITSGGSYPKWRLVHSNNTLYIQSSTSDSTSASGKIMLCGYGTVEADVVSIHSNLVLASGAIYSNTKKSITDGVAGSVLGSNGVYITSASNPYIRFYASNATTTTQQITASKDYITFSGKTNHSGGLQSTTGTFSQSVNLLGGTSNAFNSEHIKFNDGGARIGANTSNDIGIYARQIYIRPASSEEVSTLGVHIDNLGVTNLLGALTIQGIKVSKSKDDVLYIDGNLVVRGGITMYGTNESSSPSILDSLPIASTSSKGIAQFDSKHFTVSSGVVSVIEDALGLNTTELKEYLSSNSYLTTPVADARYLKLSSIADGANRVADAYGTSGWDDANNSMREKAGIYFVHTSSGSNYSGHISGMGIRLQRWNDSGSYTAGQQTFDIYSPYTQGGNVWIRQGKGDGTQMVYEDWYKLIHSGNYSDYALPRTGGTLTGVLQLNYALGANSYIRQINLRATASAGGWSVTFLRADNAVGTRMWSLGSYGTIDATTYIYMGYNDYSSTSNFRIYTDKYIFGGANVGIGIINPEYKLHVYGGGICAGNSSYESASLIIAENKNGKISLHTDTNRGVYEHTNKSWLIGTNGTNTFLSVGKVGVGTNNPQYNLHVIGTIYSSGAASLGSTLSVAGAVTFQSTLTGNYWYLSNVATNPYLRLTRETQNWYVQAVEGSIGIGSAIAKSLKVDTEGNTSIVGSLTLANTSDAEKANIAFSRAHGYITFPTSVNFGTDTNSAGTVMRVSNEGRVGIKTTTPERNLDVVGTFGVSGVSYYGDTMTKYNSDKSYRLVFAHNVSSSGVETAHIYNITNDGKSMGDLRLGRTQGTDLIIKASGKVGIGGVEPEYKLHVVGSSFVSEKMIINGIELSKSQNDVLYINGNLVVRGGITMYGSDSTTAPSIIDSLPIASTSAKGIAQFNPDIFSVTNGIVTINDGSVGLNENELHEYLTSNSYLTQSTGDGRYLKLTGGTLSTDSATVLVIKNTATSNTSYYSGIRFYHGTSARSGIHGKKDDEYLYRSSSNFSNVYKIWDSGNDGEDSGLDADMLDGYHRRYFSCLYGGLSLAATETNPVDLNTLTSPNSYYQAASAGVKYVTNKPSGIYIAFRLYVSRSNGVSSEYLRQRIQAYSQPAIYERTSVNGGSSWTDWTLVQTDLGSFVAPSSSKLNTPVNLWGNSFDGTESIGGDLIPSKTSSKSLGSSSLRWNAAYINDIHVTSNARITADASTSVHMYFKVSDIVPMVIDATSVRTGQSSTGTISLGTLTRSWKSLYVNAQSSAFNSGVIFTNGTSGVATIGSATNGAVGIYGIGTSSKVVLRAGCTSSAASSTGLVIDNDGNTEIQGGALSIPTATSSVFSSPQINLGNGGARIGATSAGFFAIYAKTSIRISQDSATSAGTNGLWIYTGGYVGINNSTPTHTLDVKGTLNATGAATLKSTLAVTSTSTFTGSTTHTGGIKTSTISGNGSHLTIGNSSDNDFAYIKVYQDLMGYNASGTNKWSISVAGVASFESMSMSSLSVNGTSTLSTLTAGSTTVSSLTVTGLSLFKGNTTHNGHVYFASGTTYYVDTEGDAKFGAISGTTGSFSSTLSATGAATLSSTLSVTGATTLKSTLKGNYWYLNNSSTNSYLRLNKTSLTSSYWYLQAVSGYIALGSTSSASMKIDEEGNVIIPGNLLVKGGITMYDTSDSAPATELYTKRIVLTETSNSTAFNENGVMFGSNGVARIGTNTSNALALYAGGQIYLRPNSLEEASSIGMILNTAGNVALSGGMTIGATSVNSNVTNGTYKLHVTGSAYITGTLTQNSDIRYKIIHKDLELGLQTMAEAPCFEYHFNEDENMTANIGTSAQYWQVVDGVTRVNEDGRLGMDYSSLGVVMAISLAKELSKFESETDRRIRLLEEENAKLRKEINELKTV